MGIIDKVATNRLIQPLPAPAGPWIQPLLAESAILDTTIALNLALYRSFIDVDPGDAESYFVFSNEKRIASSVASARTKASVVRADADDLRIFCAAAGHGWFTRDWTLRATTNAAASGQIEVIQHRTIDNSVPNSELLKEARSGLATALLEGPGEISVSPGGFNLDRLVERRNLSGKSVYYGDHFHPLPAAFHDGARINLPAGSRPSVEASLTTGLATGLAPAIPAGSGREGIMLDGGRRIENCFIDLTRDDDAPKLVFHLPSEGATSRQRTFRAAVRCLDLLALGLSETCPDAAASINAFIGECTAGRQDPARFDRFIPAWGGTEPTGVVVLQPGSHLPLLCRIRTTIPAGELDRLMAMAAAWLLPRERSWSRGVRQAKRAENRRYTTRGPSQRLLDGNVMRAHRYGEYGEIAVHKHPYTNDEASWFWQVNGNINALDDGRSQVLVSIASLSRTADILCYAQELARFLAAYEWQISDRDSSAEFETVSLVV